MKKLLLLLLLVTLIVGGAVGCGSRTHAIVGTWEIEDTGNFSFIFDEDGTGVEVWSTRTDTFSWSISGRNLTLDFGGGETEVLPFAISGDTLTLTEDGYDLVFIRR